MRYLIPGIVLFIIFDSWYSDRIDSETGSRPTEVRDRRIVFLKSFACSPSIPGRAQFSDTTEPTRAKKRTGAGSYPMPSDPLWKSGGTSSA